MEGKRRVVHAWHPGLMHRAHWDWMDLPSPLDPMALLIKERPKRDKLIEAALTPLKMESFNLGETLENVGHSPCLLFWK